MVIVSSLFKISTLIIAIQCRVLSSSVYFLLNKYKVFHTSNEHDFPPLHHPFDSHQPSALLERTISIQPAIISYLPIKNRQSPPPLATPDFITSQHVPKLSLCVVISIIKGKPLAGTFIIQLG